jgi:hypothetical protein
MKKKQYIEGKKAREQFERAMGTIFSAKKQQVTQNIPKKKGKGKD